MPSTPCSVDGESYTLDIFIDDVSKEASASSMEELEALIDSWGSSSNRKDAQDSIQLRCPSSTAPIVPKSIALQKILSVQLSDNSAPQFTSSTVKQRSDRASQSIAVDVSYVDISNTFLWQVKRLTIDLDCTVARQFCSVSDRYLSKLSQRPRRLLVFVNPECGKGIGNSVYEEQVLPLFEQAKIAVDTIYTERANHARDHVATHALDECDGIVAVGGDGMFSEVSHSLLLKTAEESKVDINDRHARLIPPKLRIGVIPAGSTDAVVFGTTGHNDPVTSALQIITGQSLLIDMTTIHNEHGFTRFMATMFAYGFFGNVIEQSDEWRFLGPLRYTMAGVFQFLRNRSYPVQVTITQPSDDRPLTYQGHYKSINCLNMPGRCDKSKFGMAPTVHLADGSFDVVLVKHSWRLQFLRFLRHVAKDSRGVEKLSNVERHRATEVSIRPTVRRREELGSWACDGELIEANEVTIRAHHRALRLFATGIRLDQIKQINEKQSQLVASSWTKRAPIVLVLLCFLVLCFAFLFALARK